MRRISGRRVSYLAILAILADAGVLVSGGPAIAAKYLGCAGLALGVTGLVMTVRQARRHR